MSRIRIAAALCAAGTAILAAGCSTAPQIDPYGPPVVNAGPVVPAYVQGDMIGSTAARVKKARSAGIKPLTAAEAMDYLAREQLELRRQTAGTGVDVIRSGDIILMRLPDNVTFNVGSANISPQAIATINEIALTLKSFDRSLVDVLGHTDSSGTAAVNKALSERRAQAVAAQLRSRGVAAARIASRGYGPDYPIADNATEEGRSTNRRVEIRLIPLR